MRPGGGKAKGSAFERDICKELSLWVSHGKREDLFWRSAMSGGRATVGRKVGKDFARHAGDISATSPAGHALTDVFFIECKFVRDLRIGQWVLQRPSVISKFWETAVLQSTDHKLRPMLIAKQNGGPIIVCINSKDARGYDWARESAIARILGDRSLSVAVLSFEQMIKTKFSMRFMVP